MPTQSSASTLPGGEENELVKKIYETISSIPSSSEPLSANPSVRVHQLILTACRKSAVYSGSLAIPPGPLGMLTVIPDLLGIWHIQRQLVADIAGCYGKQAKLTREVMLYCLFRHGASVIVREIVTRVGERLVVRRVALRFLQNVIRKVGVKITQRVIGRTISRWIPLIGAAGIAGFSFFDTKRVGLTAVDAFSREIDIEETDESST